MGPQASCRNDPNSRHSRNAAKAEALEASSVMVRVWFCMPLQKGSQELQLLQSLLDNPTFTAGGGEGRDSVCLVKTRLDSTARFHPAKQNLNLHATCPSDRRSCSWSLRCCRLRPALSGFGMKWRWPPRYESAREHSSRSRPDSPHSPQELETSESDHPRATATRPVLKTSIET